MTTNEVVNILTVLGDISKVKEVFKTIIVSKLDIFNLSLNKITPMPLEIKMTSSPVWLMTQSEFNRWMEHYGDDDWEEGKNYPITKEQQEYLLSKYGVDNWVDWSIKNWGCLWDIQSTVTLEKLNKIKFWTNDYTPKNAFITLSSKYPNLTFKLEFASEDLGSNVGVYYFKNGKVIDSNIPNPLSVEAYSQSIDITGDEYYVTTFLEGLTETERYERFPQLCIEVAYRQRRITKDIPSFILDKFERWAVRDEDYEFVNEIKNLKSTCYE